MHGVVRRLNANGRCACVINPLICSVYLMSVHARLLAKPSKRRTSSYVFVCVLF